MKITNEDRYDATEKLRKILCGAFYLNEPPGDYDALANAMLSAELMRRINNLQAAVKLNEQSWRPSLVMCVPREYGFTHIEVPYDKIPDCVAPFAKVVKQFTRTTMHANPDVWPEQERETVESFFEWAKKQARIRNKIKAADLFCRDVMGMCNTGEQVSLAMPELGALLGYPKPKPSTRLPTVLKEEGWYGWRKLSNREEESYPVLLSDYGKLTPKPVNCPEWMVSKAGFEPVRAWDILYSARLYASVLTTCAMTLKANEGVSNQLDMIEWRDGSWHGYGKPTRTTLRNNWQLDEILDENMKPFGYRKYLGSTVTSNVTD